jgi:hypothetical protein
MKHCGSMIIISTIEAVDGEMSMVAEYMEVVCVRACVVGEEEGCG